MFWIVRLEINFFSYRYTIQIAICNVVVFNWPVGSVPLQVANPAKGKQFPFLVVLDFYFKLGVRVFHTTLQKLAENKKVILYYKPRYSCHDILDEWAKYTTLKLYNDWT